MAKQRLPLAHRYFGLGKTPESFGLGNGLGQAEETAALRKAFDVNFTLVPPIEYVSWTIDLPLLDTDLDATFGDEIDLFGNTKSVPGVQGVDSSFVQNGQLQVDMLCVGFGVHIYGEPLNFSTTGNVLTPTLTGAPVPVSADVFTEQDANPGASSSLGLSASQTMNPATLEWGGPAWQAGWHMANAYQFQWVYQQRFTLIDELANDVAFWGSYADSVAAGTSEVPVQFFARRSNDRYNALARGNTFIPVNARRVGHMHSVQGAYLGLFRPTRDFDLAPATWGGLKHQGASNNPPFRRLIRPVLLEKGIPIGMFLRVQDSYHHTQMLRHMSVTNSNLGENLCFDTSAGSGIMGTAASPVFLELSLDATPVATPLTVRTCRSTRKGGALKVAILIKGFEIWGEWKKYIDRLGDVYSPAAAMSGGGPMALSR